MINIRIYTHVLQHSISVAATGNNRYYSIRQHIYVDKTESNGKRCAAEIGVIMDLFMHCSNSILGRVEMLTTHKVNPFLKIYAKKLATIERLGLVNQT